eukprot:scaffold27173_cov60-Phaeocystis_antarctica.AAC.2
MFGGDFGLHADYQTLSNFTTVRPTVQRKSLSYWWFAELFSTLFVRAHAPCTAHKHAFLRTARPVTSQR